MTFLEFNYMILHGATTSAIWRRKWACGCRWAAATNGAISSTGWNSAAAWMAATCSKLTTPLLTTADGGKMGKMRLAGLSAGNEAQLPNYDFWQYWRNVDDRDVGRFLRLFTISRSMRSHASKRSKAPRSAICENGSRQCGNRPRSGGEAATTAERTAADTFAGGGAGEDLPTLEVGEDGMRIGAVLTYGDAHRFQRRSQTKTGRRCREARWPGGHRSRPPRHSDCGAPVRRSSVSAEKTRDHPPLRPRERNATR